MQDRHLRRRCGCHRHRQAAAVRRLQERDHVRPQGRDLRGPVTGLNWIKEEMAQVTNLEKQAGLPCRYAGGRRCVHRRVRPRHGDDGNGADHEPGRHHLCLCQPHAGDFPGRGQGRRRERWFPPAAATIPNQINNVLAFPGIFRGAFDVRASDINEEMKIAAANALANLISDEELNADYIIPAAFDPRVGPAVAKAVAEAARKSGVARI